MENRLKMLPAEVIDRLLPQRREKQRREEFDKECERLANALFRQTLSFLQEKRGYPSQFVVPRTIEGLFEGQVPGSTIKTLISLDADAEVEDKEGIPRLEFHRFFINACNDSNKKLFLRFAHSFASSNREGDLLTLDYVGYNQRFDPSLPKWRVDTEQRRWLSNGLEEVSGSPQASKVISWQSQKDPQYIRDWIEGTDSWQPVIFPLSKNTIDA